MARDRKQAIIALLHAFEPEILIRTWNNYCSEENMEDYIWENEDYNINQTFNGDAHEALRAACYGEYKFTDDNYIINDYGNLTSFDDEEAKDHIDFDTLAEYIMDNGCDEISEVWMEDMVYDFMDYVLEKSGKELSEGEVYDMIEAGTDLVTDDWDDIIEEMSEEEQ